MTRSILGFFPLRPTPVEEYHPGVGRGPIGKANVMMRTAPSAASPNWAPAFAGVVFLNGKRRA